MGACFDSALFEGTLTEKELKVRFEAHQNDCALEDGNSYSGRLNMCRGLTIYRKTFNSEAAAQEFIESVANKWEEAHAVVLTVKEWDRTVLSDNPKYQAIKEQFQTKAIEWQHLNVHGDYAFGTWTREYVLADLKAKLFRHLAKGKAFATCKNCNSKVALPHVHSATCPVCRTADALGNPTLDKRLDSAFNKIVKVMDTFEAKVKKMEAAFEAKSPAKTYWYVGGICAS